MPVHEPRPRSLRVVTRALAGSLALVACASNLPEPMQREAAPQAAPAPVMAPAEPAPAAEEHAELELSLAAYEQQLARNEARLQAMGVRLAMRPDASREKQAAEPSADERFAPPPPAMAGDAATSRSAPSAPMKAKKSASRKDAKPTEAPAPAPRPTTSASASGRGAGHGVITTKAEASTRRDLEHCSELCDLASSTCELEAKICDLAARHLDEPRYGEVCQRAGEDCRIASEACNLCSP